MVVVVTVLGGSDSISFVRLARMFGDRGISPRRQRKVVPRSTIAAPHFGQYIAFTVPKIRGR
jgi:hypothetical protein